MRVNLLSRVVERWDRAQSLRAHARDVTSADRRTLNNTNVDAAHHNGDSPNNALIAENGKQCTGGKVHMLLHAVTDLP